MAQLAAYGTLYEHLLTGQLDSIGAVSLAGQPYCDPSRQIAAIPVATSISGNYLELSRAETILRGSTDGLSLRSWSMQEQGNSFTANVGVVLLVPMNPQWPLEPVRVPTHRWT